MKSAGVAAGMLVLALPALAAAQDTGVHVRAARVLATDPEAVAQFYEQAFGMSETRRAANTATFSITVRRPCSLAWTP